MDTSSLVVDKAQQLAAAGRHAEVVSYLGARKGTELADSPSLALLYGTAQARLGRHAEGLRWVDVALDQARKLEEPAVEARSEEHTSELQSLAYLVCRLLLEKKKKKLDSDTRGRH